VDGDTHIEITGDLPDDSPLKSHANVVSDGDNWKLQQGTSISVKDRDIGPDGQRVSKVEAGGAVVGWTNRANFAGAPNSGFDLVNLGITVLNTPVDHDIDGVHPCDTRVGVHHDHGYVHVDTKPRYHNGWIRDGL